MANTVLTVLVPADVLRNAEIDLIDSIREDVKREALRQIGEDIERSFLGQRIPVEDVARQFGIPAALIGEVRS